MTDMANEDPRRPIERYGVDPSAFDELTPDPVIPPEAAEAVARQVFFAKHGLDWDFVWFAHGCEVMVRHAREVATRTADARTDPSGPTDLPPTPDAEETP